MLIPYKSDFIDTDILDLQLGDDKIRCYVEYLKEQIKTKDAYLRHLNKHRKGEKE